MNNSQNEIHIYTDGSCNPPLKIGGWASILLFEGEILTLSGGETGTTHNRMELISIIRALQYITENCISHGTITIHSDSQYAVSLMDRRKKLAAADFTTKNGAGIRNRDLVRELFGYLDSLHPVLKKIKAHQRKSESENFNREADRLARKIVREHVRKYHAD